jgi:regulatory protein
MSNDAFTWAVRWLARRALTRQELHERLSRRGFDPTAVDQTLKALAERGWIDEDAIAAVIVERGLAHHHGPRHILSQLVRRGVDDAIVTRYADQLRQINWQEIAEPLLRRYDKDDPRARARVLRRLAREGFPVAVLTDTEDRNQRSDASDGSEDR